MPENTKAADIMQRKLITIPPNKNVMEAVEILLKNKISGAPVVDSNGKLVGILSELDCANEIINSAMMNTSPPDVADIMSTEVFTVRPDENMLTIAHLFTTKGYRRLPVVDEQGRLLGQLSRRDLMRAMYEAMKRRDNKRPKPLYLSAIYDSGDMPAQVTPDV